MRRAAPSARRRAPSLPSGPALRPRPPGTSKPARKEAEEAKRKGEEEAARERDKAKEESGGGGFFGWVASRATALFNRVRDAVANVFNRVRSAITTAINRARDLAKSVIDRAVRFVADKVKAVAARIVAIGDRLIPGFAALRQRFRTWIVNRVRRGGSPRS